MLPAFDDRGVRAVELQVTREERDRLPRRVGEHRSACLQRPGTLPRERTERVVVDGEPGDHREDVDLRQRGRVVHGRVRRDRLGGRASVSAWRPVSVRRSSSPSAMPWAQGADAAGSVGRSIHAAITAATASRATASVIQHRATPWVAGDGGGALTVLHVLMVGQRRDAAKSSDQRGDVHSRSSVTGARILGQVRAYVTDERRVRGRRGGLIVPFIRHRCSVCGPMCVHR